MTALDFPNIQGFVDRGYRLPAGANIALCPWVTHRHPGHWPDPDRIDPDRFTPEREAVLDAVRDELRRRAEGGPGEHAG